MYTTRYTVVLPEGPQRRHEEMGWKVYLDSRDIGTWVAKKSNHKWRFFQESCCSSLQWVVTQSEWKGWSYF